jgi:hypothetical protein
MRRALTRNIVIFIEQIYVSNEYQRRVFTYDFTDLRDPQRVRGILYPPFIKKTAKKSFINGLLAFSYVGNGVNQYFDGVVIFIELNHKSLYCIIEEENYQQFEYVLIFKCILLENI